MADKADLAGELIEWREDLQRWALAAAAAQAPRLGTLRCVECDDPIPEARRRAIPGCRLCVECQGFAEGRR